MEMDLKLRITRKDASFKDRANSQNSVYSLLSALVCFFRMDAAVFTSTATPSQIIQLDRGPALNRKLSVQPRSPASAQAAKA